MSQRVPFTGGEKVSLHVSLDRHRDVVLWKIDGLHDEQLRRPMTPSGTSLLGLVKHLAAVEYGWFCHTFQRQKRTFDGAVTVELLYQHVGIEVLQDERDRLVIGVPNCPTQTVDRWIGRNAARCNEGQQNEEVVWPYSSIAWLVRMAV